MITLKTSLVNTFLKNNFQKFRNFFGISFEKIRLLSFTEKKGGLLTYARGGLPLVCYNFLQQQNI